PGVGAGHAGAVALPGVYDDHGPCQRPPDDLVITALAGLLAQQLGVGQTGDDAGLGVRQDRRAGPQGAGAGGAPAFVGPGGPDQADAPHGTLVAVEAGVAAH